jgi:BirA family biotin operon repressor/biotin-[acetyl-CoA-carboxylase] ligase
MKPLLSAPAEANLVWVDDLDSTNEMLARVQSTWPDDDERILADTLLVAGRQSAGRGRGSHRWESPPGGLYASWLAYLETARLAWLPLAAGVSLLDALEEVMAPQRFGLKWPNDVVSSGGKLAGVLCQARTRGEGCWVVVGFGVNIEAVPELAAATAPASSLRALGLEGAVSAAIWRIVELFLAGIRPAIADPARTRARWSSRSAHAPGDLLRVRSGGEVVTGAFSGFAEDGSLKLTVNGAVRSFSAAELVAPLPEKSDTGKM